MEQKERQESVSYAIINNIPFDYHSRDLRNYFSQFIEGKGFEIFHFRHRPELQLSSNDAQSEEPSDQNRKKCTCCVIKIRSGKLKTFLSMYNRKHWIDKSGNVMAQLCFISRIKLPHKMGDKQLVTRGEQKVIPTDREQFTQTDLDSLPELHPPDVMPHGNVGTPTMVFMDFIKQCRLPPSIIKKLGLSFPRVRSSKMYGNVNFDYGWHVEKGSSEPEVISVCTGDGHEIVTEDRIQGNHARQDGSTESKEGTNLPESNTRKKKRKRKGDEEMKRRMDLGIEEKMIHGDKADSEGDNDSCEEWERHEALYDDVSNQERNKERLFDEYIELKWEKGGSGLVFYTDAQYWQEQEGDFDEQTADDWDVDMSGYYEQGAGDKDSRDYQAMRQEKRRRHGVENTDRFTAGIATKISKSKPRQDDEDDTIGKFEVHTKGIGRKILEGQGWSEGQGLGSTIKGMAEALDNEGQAPKDKRGFGYHGEKLIRHAPRAQRKVIISTIFDKPSDTDPQEPLHRRHEPYSLKYRDEVIFEKSKEIVKL